MWKQHGYFDIAGEYKPLLHLWSLGIEEQFYLCYPLILWLCWKSRFKNRHAIITVAVVSFSYYLYQNCTDAGAAFYSPLTRAWELMVGGLLSRKAKSKRISPKWRIPPLVMIGIILATINFLLPANMSNIPYETTLAVFGSYLLLSYAPLSPSLTKMLSFPALISIGLISYPLYLWHYPLLAFVRIAKYAEPDLHEKFVILLFSLFLSWLTYIMLERPIRATRQCYVPVALMSLMLLTGMAGYHIDRNNGFYSVRNFSLLGASPEAQKQLDRSPWPYTNNPLCLAQYPFPPSIEYGWWFCMKSAEPPPTMIILGNSLANQYYPGFAYNNKLRKQSILNIGTCDFDAKEKFIGDPHNPCYGDRNKEQNDFIDEIVRNSPTIRYAIVGGITIAPTEENIELTTMRINKLESRGIRVIVMVPHFRPDFLLEACYPTVFQPSSRDCTFSDEQRQKFESRFKPLITRLSKSNPHVLFFNPNSIFCSGSSCSFVLNGMPLFRDEVHLSEYGSMKVQEVFAEWATQNIPEIFEGSF